MHARTLRSGIALLLGTVLLSGCFGQFALVRTVYNANESIDNKWARSGVTALLVIIPVYGLAGLADWIILNPIEFWTKKNPVSGKPPAKSTSENGIPQNGTRTTLNKNGERVVVSWHYSADRNRVSAIVVTLGKDRKPSVRLVRSRATNGLASGPVSVTDVTFDKTTPSFHRSVG